MGTTWCGVRMGPALHGFTCMSLPARVPPIVGSSWVLPDMGPQHTVQAACSWVRVVSAVCQRVVCVGSQPQASMEACSSLAANRKGAAEIRKRKLAMCFQEKSLLTRDPPENSQALSFEFGS
eukprot:221481-Pelagomonas_calceolata.AAC.2